MYCIADDVIKIQLYLHKCKQSLEPHNNQTNHPQGWYALRMLGGFKHVLILFVHLM